MGAGRVLVDIPNQKVSPLEDTPEIGWQMDWYQDEQLAEGRAWGKRLMVTLVAWRILVDILAFFYSICHLIAIIY